MQSKRIFNEEEINYIKENWGKVSVYAMRKELKCSSDKVKNVAMSLNLEKPPTKSPNWTTEEKEKLKELAKIKNTCEEIAEELGRTTNAVYIKARKLGIILYLDGRKWTDQEKDVLKEFWGYRKIELIAKDLHRSVNGLKIQASRMHLGPMICNNVDYFLISDISELFKISSDRVRDTWIKHGLKTKKVHVSKERFYLGVTLENLLKFLKENQELWDSKKLEENILGPEPKWLTEKRKIDKNKEYIENNRWTEEEKRKAIFWIKQRKSYEFIAEKVNHSPSAVARFLQERGYSYLVLPYWTTKEIKYVKENKDKLSANEIALQLNKEVQSVRNMKVKLSYIVTEYIPHEWDEEENQYLLNNYRKIPNYEIANYLGVSREILIEQLKELGLYKSRTHIWKEEENEFIRKNYKKGMKTKFAQQFHVSDRTITKHLRNLNIDENKSFSEVEILEKRKELLYVLKNLLEIRKEQNENLDIIKK